MGFKSRARERRSEAEGELKKTPDARMKDPFKRNSLLFHRGTIDRINDILNSGRLSVSEGKAGISFTEGITPIPGHGDTAIVFHRDFLNKNGLKTQKIDYDDKKMLQRFKVLDDPEMIRKSTIENMQFKLQISQVHVSVTPSTQVLQNHEKAKKLLNPDRVNSMSDRRLYTRQIEEYRLWENEVIARTQSIEFERSDVVAIVSLHRFFENHYSALKKFSDKVIYIDDLLRFEPDGTVHVIRLQKEHRPEVSERMTRVRRMEKKFPAVKHLREYSLESYHLACSLIEHKDDYDICKQQLIDLKFPTPPKELTKFLPQLSKLPNDWFKTDFLDHFLSRLNHTEHAVQNGMDELFISEIERRLSIID